MSSGCVCNVYCGGNVVEGVLRVMFVVTTIAYCNMVLSSHCGFVMEMFVERCEGERCVQYNGGAIGKLCRIAMISAMVLYVAMKSSVRS